MLILPGSTVFTKSHKNGKESSSECVVASCFKSLWKWNFLNLILIETPCRQLKTAINLISLFSVLLDALILGQVAFMFIP